MSKTINALMGIKPKPRIRDYAKVDHIFGLYWKDHFDTMAKEIYWFKEWDFFVELAIYLDMNLKNECIRKFFMQDIFSLFAERKDEVINEINIKKRKRRYGL